MNWASINYGLAVDEVTQPTVKGGPREAWCYVGGHTSKRVCVGIIPLCRECAEYMKRMVPK